MHGSERTVFEKLQSGKPLSGKLTVELFKAKLKTYLYSLWFGTQGCQTIGMI